MLTPTELTERLLQSGLCAPSKLRGCTVEELKQIEHHIGQPLPDAYKKVMEVIGKGAGDFCSDVDMYYPSVITLTAQMRPLIAEEGRALPEDAFVFADRDGEQTLFFRLGDLDPDPPVYRWAIDSPKRFPRIFSSVWDFIEEQLDSHESRLE